MTHVDGIRLNLNLSSPLIPLQKALNEKINECFYMNSLFTSKLQSLFYIFYVKYQKSEGLYCSYVL